MDEGIYIAAAGGIKQQRKLDLISNNLANLNNVGFKKDQAMFQALLTPFKEDLGFEASRAATLPPTKSNETVSYVGISGFSTDHSQGTLLNTQNPLDLALDGEGYFAIQTPAGIRYTRKGDFRLDAENRLVTQNGHPVLTEKGGPLVLEISGKAVDIDANGTVTVGAGLENTSLGKLRVVDFADKSKLMKEGDGLFRAIDPKAEKPAQNASVRQGFLENSNVNSVGEMSKMVETLRTFEAYQKVIQSIDHINTESANTIGRVV
ncbi:MAG: flagellar basal-body rod protein FlgF [Nitrospinae bacterium]|nr:flagellar basal-body rod protein FlgF [Nitrospinota bacterium]